jgi:aryl-alcohol dehydrogenase-like predicted oxidoreductase
MLGHVAVGTWSGGRFMRFGEPIAEERLEALLRPGDGIDTVMTADAYGAGEADTLLGRALAGVPRADYALAGAVGHDFYEGERNGAKGFPRFTDPRLRGPEAYGDYLRMATERSLERLGVDHFDLLLLHNPDRRGFESPEVWEGLRELRDEGLTRSLGVAPGPANGFTLDVIGCFERFGELIDWAMLILGPLEPWPGELPLAAAERNDVKVVTRVVDYGGLFWDDVLPGHEFPRGDHRGFRPEGWVEAGREKLDRLRPIAERHALTPLQLACAWNLAHPAVECVAPTLIEEPGADKPIERKRAELAGVPATSPLSAEEVDAIRAIGDNRGSMLLKGATPDHEGDEAPDRWTLGPGHAEIAERWGIEPERDLRKTPAPV